MIFLLAGCSAEADDPAETLETGHVSFDDPRDGVPREYVEGSVEENNCGEADLLPTGHDPVLDWLETQRGPRPGFSGTGAKIMAFSDQGVPSRFVAEARGFLWEGTGDRKMDTAVYDREASLLSLERLEK